MKRTRIALVAFALLAAAQSARAQTVSLAEEAKPGFISVGGLVGPEFDVSDNWLLVGGDARIAVAKPAIELNPRFSFRPFDNGSMKQFDVDVLRNYDLARQGRLRPFIGAGVGISQISLDNAGSDTKVGLNLVSGARLAMRSGALYEPFLHAQYTVLHDRPDSFTIVVGAAFSLHW